LIAIVIALPRHSKSLPRRVERGRQVDGEEERLVAALQPDDVVLGGGNVKHLKQLPPGCRVGDNANAFKGGFRMWGDAPRPADGPARRHRATTDNPPLPLKCLSPTLGGP
jgi:hypothetical protein